MSTTPVTVLLPSPATVRGPRSPTEHRGFVWVERTVEVPDLRGESSCTVSRFNDFLSPISSETGICASDRHWRPTASPLRDEFGALRPYVLHPRYASSSGSDLCVYREGVLANLTSLQDEGRPEPVRGTALDANVDRSMQAALRRAHGDRKTTVGRTKEYADYPFVLAPGRTFRHVDPEFDRRLVRLVERDLALVDGTPVLRSPHPVVAVVVDPAIAGPQLRVVETYADRVERPLDHVCLVLPHEARDWIRDELRTATAHGGVLDRYLAPDVPPLVPPLEGRVTSAPEPFAPYVATRRAGGAHDAASERLAAWGEELGRRHGFTPTDPDLSPLADVSFGM